MELIVLWAFVGLLNLLILTYQDIKNKMIIDDRKNLVMLGMTASLLSLGFFKWWYYIALLVVVLLLTNWIGKKQYFGSGDVSAFRWLFLGFGYINPFSFAIFGINLLVWSAAHQGLKKVFKIRGVTPYFAVILASYTVTGLLMGFFW